MINSIKQHMPAFCDFEPEGPLEFQTVDEMLAIPWVKKWREFPNFHKFSISDRHLMAEFRGGREWWVVAILSWPIPPSADLPEWDHGIYEVMIDGKPVDVPGKDVRWSSGDDVCLRDGRTVKRR